IQEFGNDAYLAEALHVDFLSIDPLDAYQLIYARDYGEASLHRVMLSGSGRKDMKLNQPEKLRELYHKLEAWHRLARNKPFMEVFETVVRESGYLANLLSEKGWSRVEKLNTFFDEAKKMAGNRGDYSLKEFLAHLDVLEEHGVAVRSRMRVAREAVRLMTAHSAKGSEFDAVFIMGLTDGHWGNRRNFTKFHLPSGKYVDSDELEKNEDERRLFYVGLTRARKELYLTYACHAEDEREQVPSQFLEEIKPELKEVLDADKWDREFDGKKEIVFADKKQDKPDKLNRDFVRTIFEEKGLSVTALNNYLECPWQYFYQNLLRLPAAQNRYLMYGTAVHNALQKFFDARREDKKADHRFISEQFEAEIGRQPMLRDDREELLKKGKKELKEYYDFYHQGWNYNTLSEFSVRDIALAPGVKINGKLDKLELQDRPGEVIVVDYKTGQTQSRNKMEGKTEDSGGNYKRQLVFYKLLLDLYPLRKYKMISGVIDFVQPNKLGKFKREEFAVSDGEVKELRAKILEVADEIVNLKFWNKGCGEKDCEFCELRKIMT
ncbi:MAG TPA: PD-(D/E)XK nuclease family protein, partial [Candidatus Paceibacterota bacterium]